MQILAFDSSALTATVALWRDGVIVAEESCTNALNHSVRLLPMIDKVLRLSETTLEEIDAFALSVGPGSFTGVRIGISTLKGLAFSTERLCAPVSTLEALAFNEIGERGVICAVMDARRNEFYNALFTTDEDGNLARLCEDRAISAEQLYDELCDLKRPVVICGDGAALFYQHCQTQKRDNCYRLSHPTRRFQRAASVACVGYTMLDQGLGVPVGQLAPRYLRASGAERKRNESETLC